jgi:hypothetical protein
MQFKGVFENARAGIKSVTFALYGDQRGGSPLWQETQNVAVDLQGMFGVVLGSATRDGLPLDLFAKGEPRWLGFQVNGAEPQEARVLLVSVPYAMKAADADTIGGKPASAFMLARSEAQPNVDRSMATNNRGEPYEVHRTGDTGQTVIGTATNPVRELSVKATQSCA